MGMTDAQFKAFIQFVLDDIEEIMNETDEAKKAAKLRKVYEHLNDITKA